MCLGCMSRQHREMFAKLGNLCARLSLLRDPIPFKLYLSFNAIEKAGPLCPPSLWQPASNIDVAAKFYRDVCIKDPLLRQLMPGQRIKQQAYR